MQRSAYDKIKKRIQLIEKQDIIEKTAGWKGKTPSEPAVFASVHVFMILFFNRTIQHFITTNS